MEDEAASKVANRVIIHEDLIAARELAGIKDAAEKINQSNIEAAHKIASKIEESANKQIENNNRNAEEVINRLDQINDGIGDLNALIDLKSTEMIWILEQQSKYLDQISYQQTIPQELRAKELCRMAETALKNGEIPLSIKFFQESIELNPFDFVCYQGMGNIYLLEKRDPKKALEYYEKEAKYVPKEHKEYKSLALLSVGITNYILGNYSAAYNATLNAIITNPNMIEAYYQHAKYSSKTGKYAEALSNLKLAIDADPGYCKKALVSTDKEDFSPMGKQLVNFFQDLTNEMKTKAKIQIESTHQLITKFDSTGALDTAKRILDEAVKFNDLGDYLNYRNAFDKASISREDAISSLTKYYTEKESNLKDTRRNLEKRIENLEYEKNHMKEFKITGQGDVHISINNIPYWLGFGIFLGIGILFATYAYFDTVGWALVLVGSLSIVATINDSYRFHKYKGVRKNIDDKIRQIKSELDQVNIKIESLNNYKNDLEQIKKQI